MEFSEQSKSQVNFFVKKHYTANTELKWTLADFAFIESSYGNLRNSEYIHCSLSSTKMDFLNFAQLCFVQKRNPVTKTCNWIPQIVVTKFHNDEKSQYVLLNFSVF